MIEERGRLVNDAWVFWSIPGCLGVIASIINHVLVVTGNWQWVAATWIAYGVVTTVVTFLASYRERQRTRIRTFVDRVVGMTWSAFLITVSLMIISEAFFVPVRPELFGGMIAFVLGAALFVSAAITEWRPLYFAAGLYWIGGIAVMYWPREQNLIWAALFVLGYLIPAWLLRRQLHDQGLGHAATD